MAKNTNEKVVRKSRTQTDASTEPFCQVVLHNDDVNGVEHVVNCLQIVFSHNIELAAKIMMEAHQKGRSIAEVETQTPATEHCEQLLSYGLTATVEPV